MVQNVGLSKTSIIKSRLEAYTNGSKAVDLHYDKFSTTTIAASPTLPPPTVIFPYRYDENDHNVISLMLVSHARRGKYLVFGRRLLHGIPSHCGLRTLELGTTATTTTKEDTVSTSEQWRITVNNHLE
jgi:hypothetical protein